MTKPRRVQGLKSVELMPKGPWPEQKLTGRAAEGIRFQKKVGRELAPLASQGTLYDGPWFRYKDRYGLHWCQADWVLDTWDRILVFEAKLSLRRLDTGIVQLTKLYRPVLEAFFEKPVVMTLAFHHWIHEITEDPFTLIDEPADLLTVPLNSCKQPLGWHIL